MYSLAEEPTQMRLRLKARVNRSDGSSADKRLRVEPKFSARRRMARLALPLQ
jgi:hypothetical protein